MEKPDIHLLIRIEWQFFGTLTFKSERLPERIRLSMLFAFLRTVCRWYRVYFPEFLWCIRQENGEIGGRLHWHCLLGGLPQSAVSERSCFSMMATWEKLGGGMARFSEFDSSLNGVEYLLKCLGEKTDLGDLYESAKFGGKCQLMPSKSVYRVNAAALRRDKITLRAMSRTAAPLTQCFG